MTKLAIILEESHKDLYQWFLMHQECLLLQHDEHASACWQAFIACLRHHLEFENQYLLVDGVVDTSTLRWGLIIYQKEHDKVLQKLNELTELFEYYLKQQGRVKRITVLELMEKQVTFRHLLEHHETREEEDLFKQLPEVRPEAIEAFIAHEKIFEGLNDEVKGFLEGNL